MMITDIPETIICHENLQVNSRVLVSNQELRLGKSLGKGGEGEVFSLTQDTVAKIYIDKACTLRQKKKIELLVSLNIRDPEIAAPTAVITDRRGIFCGYVMPKVKGISIEKLLASPIPTERWKGWNRRNIIEACYRIVSILNKVYTIQDHYILIGDLNFGNFMATSPGNVTLVDFDSVQIDDFPCPVGTAPFTPPEILRKGKSRKTFLLEQGNEDFTIAVLLFHILCGIHPFRRIGGDTPEENILKGIFPYKPDGSVTELAPISGNVAYYWAYLPNYICSAFCDSFTTKDYQNGRTSVVQWSSLFAKYLKDFDSIVKHDPKANNIILNGYPSWKTLNDTDECLACHQIKPKNQIDNHLCYICQKKGYRLEKRKCKYCGKIELGVVLGRKRGNSDSYCCSDCSKEETFTCSICNKNFTVKHHQHDSYIHEGHIVCSDCNAEFFRIKDGIEKLHVISNPPPFEKINFKGVFENVINMAKSYVPFLKAYGGTDAEELISALASLSIQYQTQSIVFPKYQKIIKSFATNASTDPSFLRSIINRIGDVKKEIEKGVEQINVEGKVVNVKYSNLPYCGLLLSRIGTIEAETRKLLNVFVQTTLERPKKLLEETDTLFSPEKFFSVDIKRLLESINTSKKFLETKTEFEEIKKVFDELEKVSSILKSSISLKTNINTAFDCNVKNTSDIDNQLVNVRKTRAALDQYRGIVGSTIVDFTYRRLNEIEFGLQKASDFFKAFNSIRSTSLASLHDILVKANPKLIPQYIIIGGIDKLKEQLNQISTFDERFLACKNIQSLDEKNSEIKKLSQLTRNCFFSEYSFFKEFETYCKELDEQYNKYLNLVKEKESQKHVAKAEYLADITRLTKIIMATTFGAVTALYVLIIYAINLLDGVLDNINYFVHIGFGIILAAVACVIIKEKIINRFFHIIDEKMEENNGQKHAYTS